MTIDKAKELGINLLGIYHLDVAKLLAEIERLKDSDNEATELCDCLSDLLGNVAVAVRGPEERKSRHGFSDIPSRVKTAVAERDQLKAENEALRKALGEISGQVDGNIRCVVRDVVNCRGDVQDIYGYCDAIDGIIDAAMAKESSHG
ncbi:hypothetical protein [Pseudomonas sp. NMI1173_11]|uniref:hypothetical protein n=1 Tax=Pseudomonas sp. NMI1173_11 TaxID=2903145 RepID=UPI001E3D26EA|nr:hypothetical protein [Pseudomonas sp. NMI1173_11]MCE0999995.1 hypothetical protein [Pseudomonas sp. NMI1173_11]